MLITAPAQATSGWGNVAAVLGLLLVILLGVVSLAISLYIRRRVRAIGGPGESPDERIGPTSEDYET